MKWICPLFLIFIIACTPQVDCCKECLEAFQQSPDAIGVEAAQCGQFSSAKQMSQACITQFENSPKAVEACQ
ncbi:MAG: hypothetical protein ACE5FT_02520 [Candidatus Nanoarchaeia archaeon]